MTTNNKGRLLSRLDVPRLTVLLLTLVLGACKDGDSTSGPIPFEGGTFSGNFSVTFKDYQNCSSPLTQTGTVQLTFITQNTYKYNCAVVSSAWSAHCGATIYDSLSDFGSSLFLGRSMIMRDLAVGRMDPMWHNSLYLRDTLSVVTVGNYMELSRENHFAIWRLQLFRLKGDVESSPFRSVEP